MIIYQIINKINGKIYIGKTVRSLEKRMSEHFNNPSKTMPIGRAILKYGQDSFNINILCECDDFEVLNNLEVYYIKKFNSMKYGYNAREGGVGGKMTDEIKNKISKSNKGKAMSMETKQKLSKIGKGRIISKERSEKAANASRERNKNVKHIIGVTYRKNKNTYVAKYVLNQKSYSAGEYDDIEFAKMAGDFWRFFYYGEKYKLNNKTYEICTVINYLFFLLKYYYVNLPDKFLKPGSHKPRNGRKFKSVVKTSGGHYSAVIGSLKNRITIGTFYSEEICARVVDFWNIKHYRDSCYLNLNDSIELYNSTDIEKYIKDNSIGVYKFKNDGYDGPKTGSSSKYKGVAWDKNKRKWICGITVNGKKHYLGRFDNEIDAAKKYDSSVILLKNGDGYLNFPEIFEYLYL